MNPRHADFQSAALPSELSDQICFTSCVSAVTRVTIIRNSLTGSREEISGCAIKAANEWLAALNFPKILPNYAGFCVRYKIGHFSVLDTFLANFFLC